VPLNVEHRLMLGLAPDYDHLTVIQKVEVFEHALDTTSGDDLHRVMWLKSRSSEVPASIFLFSASIQQLAYGLLTNQLDATSGGDLHRLVWLKSRSSEVLCRLSVMSSFPATIADNLLLRIVHASKDLPCVVYFKFCCSEVWCWS